MKNRFKFWFVFSVFMVFAMGTDAFRPPSFSSEAIRGDVTARTDNSGSLTWFARYNAYGTRFHEVGATYDRQRGNTKDEESSFDAINDHMRWRDLIHGVYFTPDPIGYADGPNRYCYVHCNPITKFDPNGLTAHPLVNMWLNSVATRIDNAVVSSGRPSSFAAAISSGLEGMAYSGSATQAKDMYNASVDRTSAVMEQQMDMGESGLKSATVGISALVGDAVGYTPAYEAAVGNDVATQEFLSTGERVRRGVQGGSQMVLTGATLASTYNPAAQTGKLSQTVKPSPKQSSTTTETKTRPTQGADGGKSEIIIERDVSGDAISKTHRVTTEGKTVHQHQEHLGKHGGERGFPDEWTGTETINAE